MKKLIIFVSTLCFLFPFYLSGADLWPVGEPRVKRSNHSTSGTNAALHETFPNANDYKEGGRFYYSNYLNSFGQREILDTSKEIIYCESGDRDFSETIESLYRGGGSGFTSSHTFSVRDDATTVGFTPEALSSAIYQTLMNNNSDNTKGRFCYRENNPKVDYRTPGAESAVYCDPQRTPSHSTPKTFIDTSSGNTCQIQLDAPLKLNQTRFIRQLQEFGDVTIAQGFIGCFKNQISGTPEVVLVDNPSSCTKTSRDSCVRTCEWAYQVVCDAKDMPSWGKCSAYGSMLFKDDAISVNSVDSLSFDLGSRTLYKGSAVMACSMIDGRAQWVVSSQVCLPVEEPKSGSKPGS